MVLGILRCWLMQVDVSVVGKAIEHFSSTCHKLERGLASNAIVPMFQILVDECMTVIAIVAALQGPDIKDRHWLRVEGCIGHTIARDSTLLVEFVFSRMQEHQNM
jgi:hypothetical protein